MVKRRPGLALAEFKQRWLEHLKTLGKDKVVGTLATGEVALGGKEAPFDGMAALYYEKEEAALLPTDLVGETVVRIKADEHLMSHKPGGGQTKLKIVRTVYRRKDLTHQQFKDYWLKNHSKLEDRVIAESPVQRIVATFAIPQPGKNPDIDGMVELYFNRQEDIRAMFAGPIPAMMRKDEENFVQMDAPAIRAVCEEYAVRG
jgi:uncharacterized protein (TIGR02118 family)